MANLLYIDLFSGCGGLSLGLEKAGFELVLAVEKSDMAAETFFHNLVERIRDKKDWHEFCGLPVKKQAEKKIVVNAVGTLLADKELLTKLKKQEIDLVAGGPPCQGFSMAGRRNPNDIRNKLAWEFLDVVTAIQPKAVLIENVIGMSRDFVKHGKEAPFNQLKMALEQGKPAYRVQQVVVNAMHFGVPQHRPRVMLLAIRSDLATDFKFFDKIWKTSAEEANLPQSQRPDIVPIATHFGTDIRTVRDAIWDIDNTGYKHSAAHAAYLKDKGSYARDLRQDRIWMHESVRKSHDPHVLHNHTLRRHSIQIAKRFRLYQVLGEAEIPPKILNIPRQYDDAEASELLKAALKHVENTAFNAPDGITIANNKSELVRLILELGTKKHSQRPLQWNLPAPTVVSLPDDFVHPQLPRTFSVRELARFQSFPDSFVFRAKETTGSHRRRFEVPQYTQVGNAVPPLMAEAVGRTIKSLLRSASMAKRRVRSAA